MSKKTGIVLLAVLLVAGIATTFLFRGSGTVEDKNPAMTDQTVQDQEGAPSGRPCQETVPAGGGKNVSDPKRKDAVPEGADDSEGADEPQTEEEKAEAAAEAKVDAFDNLTDKWMEPSKVEVTMKAVDEFVSTFRKVPKDRQDECVHRALNLIPDENVMLLAGILMDKEMDKEIVETVFNDILNRDEDVKEPILQQIFKDKTHPCWTDTAWILDVTGDLPKAGANQATPAK